MDCHWQIKEALNWYAGHQGNWQPTVRFLDGFFQRDPERVIPVFETWPQWFHYPAMLYLRQDCGVEAWEEATSDGNSRVVKIQMSKDSSWTTIIPLHKRDLKREEEMLTFMMNDDQRRAISRMPKKPYFIV